MNPLTAKQQRMLDFIREFSVRNQYPPTYEEIRLALGMSTKSLVDHYLGQLEAAGYITREFNRPRTILLVAHG